MPIMLLLAGVFLATIALFNAEPEPDPCATYYEMRRIFHESNGEYGWPYGAVPECVP